MVHFLSILVGLVSGWPAKVEDFRPGKQLELKILSEEQLMRRGGIFLFWVNWLWCRIVKMLTDHHILVICELADFGWALLCSLLAFRGCFYFIFYFYFIFIKEALTC